MRIAMLGHAGCGGSGRIATGLARALTRRGHDTHLFVRRMAFGNWAHEPGLTIHTPDGRWAVESEPSRLNATWCAQEETRLIEELAALHAREPLDAVHWHYGFPFADMTRRAVAGMPAPRPALIGTLHGSEIMRCARDPEARRALRRALASCDALTAVSQAHAEYTRSVMGLEAPPEVIPNFLDPDWPSVPASLAERPARVVHVSNFREVKQPADSIEIFAGASLGLDSRLDVIGDGEQRPEVEACIRQLGIARRVRIVGLVDDVAAHLRRACALIVSSRYESFCLVALEAQACGVPVVAPRIGGIPEVVEDEVTGLLYAVDDFAGAASHLRRLLTTPGERLRMARAGVARAGRFTWTRIVPLYESLYGRLRQKAAA